MAMALALFAHSLAPWEPVLNFSFAGMVQSAGGNRKVDFAEGIHIAAAQENRAGVCMAHFGPREVRLEPVTRPKP
jgi:hypothetical protein